MIPPKATGIALTGELLERSFDELPVQPDRPKGMLERQYGTGASSFLDVHGTEIHYRDQGKSAPVVLALHGAYSSLHTWDGWVERLEDDVRFLRMDMPGFGLTGPERDGPHTLSSLVESVGAFCDELGLAEIAVAGNSLGGAVAWRLAIDRPDLVGRLLLVNAGGERILQTAADEYARPPQSIIPRYCTPRSVTRLILEDAYADTEKVTDDLVERYHDLLVRTGNRRAILELAREFDGGRYDPTDVDVPTLVQWGSEDEWIPVDVGRQLASAIPDAEFRRYDGVGHIAMEEAPNETAADARSFVRQ